MKRLPNEIYQNNNDFQGNLKKWLSLPNSPATNVLTTSAPALFLQKDQDWPEWALVLLVSSPIVAIIVILFITILALLLILWLRSRRRALRAEEDQIPPPSDSIEQVQDTDLEAVAEADELPPTEAALKAEPLEPPPTETTKARVDSATVPSMAGLDVEQEPQTVPISGQRPPDISWQIAGLTDVGLKRDHNEDSLVMAEAVMLDNTPYGLYAVADGLGGHHGGEIASKLSVEAIAEEFSKNPLALAAGPFDEWLVAITLAANPSILDHQEDKSQAKKMGSTLVMALVADKQTYIANVGDSRAYRLNDEVIEQISVDHSLVERLVQIGQLTREEARTHRNRNVIWNTLGDKSDPEISLYHASLQPGDRLLLCSDGLNDMVPDGELLEISRNQSIPAEACKIMVKAAKAAGGNDNITVIIAQMDE